MLIAQSIGKLYNIILPQLSAARVFFFPRTNVGNLHKWAQFTIHFPCTCVLRCNNSCGNTLTHNMYIHAHTYTRYMYNVYLVPCTMYNCVFFSITCTLPFVYKMRRTCCHCQVLIARQNMFGQGWEGEGGQLKERVALDRSSWSLKSVCNRLL